MTKIIPVHHTRHEQSRKERSVRRPGASWIRFSVAPILLLCLLLRLPLDVVLASSSVSAADGRENAAHVAGKVAESATPGASRNEATCEELAVYAEKVLAIETDEWNRLQESFGIDSDLDVLTLSPAELADLALLYDEIGAALDQIEPPPFAATWHDAQIATKSIIARILRSASDTGSAPASVLAYWEQREALYHDEQTGYLEAVAACPAFAEFWHDLDLIDGNTQSSPEVGAAFATCAGLTQYDSDLRRTVYQAMANRPELIAPYIAYLENDREDVSPGELTAVAQLFEEIRDLTVKVVPPEYAAAWHAERVIMLGMFADYFREAAEVGFEQAAISFLERSDARSSETTAALEAAAAACPVFPQFAENVG